MGLKATDECLAKVGEDEEIFVLRARDITAPGIVRSWANCAAMRNVSAEKVESARQVARAMEAWQRENGRRLPD